ncbi:MAG: hypothetical protein ACQETO_05545 [Pseudomonadota bacterium]
MQTSHSRTCRNFLVLATALLLSAAVAQAEPADWEIDPEHFSIAFEAGNPGHLRPHDDPAQPLGHGLRPGPGQ